MASMQSENFSPVESDTDDDSGIGSKTPFSLLTDAQKKREQTAVFSDFIRNEDENRQLGSSQRSGPSASSGSGSQDVSAKKKIIDSVRDYQSELFARARASNVIAVLGTGSGKTLIAALLVRDIVIKEMEDRANGKPSRTSFFLTNSVALAEQQHSMLSDNLATAPALVHGRGKDNWKKDQWNELFAGHEAVVCTPEILYQCLNRAFIKIEEINLIIFDEAHHAKKEHPYARIIKDHYQARRQSSLRPKMFGTTASPVDGKGDVMESAHMLESLLSAKIVTTKSLSLDTHTPKATVQEWEYEKASAPLATALYQRLNFCQDVTAFAPQLEESERVCAQLGAWCSDRALTYTFEEQQFRKLLHKYEGLNSHEQSDGLSQASIWFEKLKQAQEIVESQSLPEPQLSGHSLSPKVLVLYHKLYHYFSTNENTRCLIFVDRRITALVLCDLFRQLDVPNLRTDVFLGAGGSKSGLTGLSGLQARTLKVRFESGLVNCLFCTSVAEEGIDSPECNLVIRFDLYDTMIQYVQSRGRARAKSSIYGQMIERGNTLHRVRIEDARYHEFQLRDFLANLEDDRFLENDYLGIAGALSKEKPNKTFGTRAGTTCSYRTAIQYLDAYVNSLRYETVGEPRITYEPEIADGMFMFRTILPDASPLKGVVGDPFANKTTAKQSAAWETCFALRTKGLLDENLESTYLKQRPANANMRVAISTAKKDEYPMLVKPEFWTSQCGQAPTLLYAATIQVIPSARVARTYGPLLLLTRSSLPSLPDFPVYLDGDIEAKVTITRYSSPFSVESPLLESLQRFTVQIFRDLFNKDYKADDAQMPYWLAPPNPALGNSVSSKLEDLVVAAIGKSWEPLSWSAKSDPDSWCGQFLIDKWSGKYRYWSHEVLHNLDTNSRVPTGVGARRSKGVQLQAILEYTLSLFGSSRGRFLENCDRSQPVLKAELVRVRRDFLDKHDPKGHEEYQQWYHVCPEPLAISMLPHGVITTALVFPAIVSRMDSYLIAAEAVHRLGLKVAPGLALEAITKDADNTEEHRDQQIHFQRGMGKNYERLEFLGDAFLKMTTSIMVFLRYPDSDELGYHVKRMEMICNLNLFNVAADPVLDLTKYIRTQGFNRRYWYPEGMILRGGKGAVQGDMKPFKHEIPQHGLGKKTIADVSEALIGAALQTNHTVREDNKYDVAIYAVTKLVRSENHDIQSWSDYRRLYNPPSWSTYIQPDGFTYGPRSPASRIQKRMGYTFNLPRLLRSAMTHPSLIQSAVPDYQRLEFLGDSVLDMVCIRHLYDCFPDRDPQWLTEHKMAMVSNKFLGALAVDFGFDKCLQYTGAHVGRMISDYAFKIRDGLAEAKNTNTIDFWTEIEDAPKCLSDSVESYIGAVFVDSGFNFGQVERFFRDHVYWYFSDMKVYDTFANKHPTTELHNMLTKQFKCQQYHLLAHDHHATQRSGKAGVTLLPPAAQKATPRVTAGVLIHGRVVRSATRESGRYAKIRVSKDVLSELRGTTRQEFRKRFGCRCREGDLGTGLNGVAVPIGGGEEVSAL